MLREHFLCSVLKSGSTSWQVFFHQHQIQTRQIVDCAYNDSCPAPSNTHLNIIQVKTVWKVNGIVDNLPFALIRPLIRCLLGEAPV